MAKDISNAQVLTELRTEMRVTFDKLDNRITALDQKFTNKFDDILAIVQFTQSEMGQMVTKTELDERFTESESRIMIHIDGVVQLYTRLDTEYVAM